MKHALVLLFAILVGICTAGTITYTVPGTAGSSVTVAGLRSADGSPMTVNFGDGTTDTLASSGRVVHTYAAASTSITVSNVDSVGGKMGPYSNGGSGPGSRQASISSGANCTAVSMSGITAIRDHAFCGFSKLTSVTVPEGVKAIGVHAFEGCSAMTSLSLPSTLERVGAHCVTYCKALASISLASGNTNFTAVGSTAIKKNVVHDRWGGDVIVLCTAMPSGYTRYLQGNIATLTTTCVQNTSYVEVQPCLAGNYPGQDPDWSPLVRAAQFAKIKQRTEGSAKIFSPHGWTYASYSHADYIDGDTAGWIDFDWDYGNRDAW